MNTLPHYIKTKLQELREKFNVIPVPVVAIAKDLGITIFETFDFSASESGSIRKEKAEYIIYLNGLDIPTRKRFTIAHEIGHFLLHRDYLDQGHEAVTNIKQPVVLNRASRPKVVTAEDKKREIEANKFAAELLMPKEAFEAAFEEANNLEELANTFNVSPSAAAVRAENLLGYTII